MSVCGKCLYNKNCQFLAKYKIEPDGCSAFRNAEDFVEVVRCGKCKHYYQYHVYETNEATGWGKCTLINMDINMTVGDYCSHGERKEENAID